MTPEGSFPHLADCREAFAYPTSPVAPKRAKTPHFPPGGYLLILLPLRQGNYQKDWTLSARLGCLDSLHSFGNAGAPMGSLQVQSAPSWTDSEQLLENPITKNQRSSSVPAGLTIKSKQQLQINWSCPALCRSTAFILKYL